MKLNKEIKLKERKKKKNAHYQQTRTPQRYHYEKKNILYEERDKNQTHVDKTTMGPTIPRTHWDLTRHSNKLYRLQHKVG
jgi:hypothetical protein